MKGGKNTPTQTQSGVHRAVLGRFGYFRPPDRVRHAALKIFHRSNRKSVGWELSFGQNKFFVAPNRSCQKRHWFPADRIDCLPFWSGRFFRCSYIYYGETKCAYIVFVRFCFFELLIQFTRKKNVLLKCVCSTTCTGKENKTLFTYFSKIFVGNICF